MTDALPDVVLMDLLMPGMDGIEATRQLKHRWPVVEVVAVTSFLEEAKVRAALEAGAAGYLLKDADADAVAAIRAAAAGECHLDPAVGKLVAASLRAPRPVGDNLTTREREVLTFDRGRGHQPADRPQARRHRADRPDPRVQHPRETRPGFPHPGSALGRPGKASRQHASSPDPPSTRDGHPAQ